MFNKILNINKKGVIKNEYEKSIAGITDCSSGHCIS